jgi:hypothetical protein
MTTNEYQEEKYIRDFIEDLKYVADTDQENYDNIIRFLPMLKKIAVGRSIFEKRIQIFGEYTPEKLFKENMELIRAVKLGQKQVGKILSSFNPNWEEDFSEILVQNSNLNFSKNQELNSKRHKLKNKFKETDDISYDKFYNYTTRDTTYYNLNTPRSHNKSEKSINNQSTLKHSKSLRIGLNSENKSKNSSLEKNKIKNSILNQSKRLNRNKEVNQDEVYYKINSNSSRNRLFSNESCKFKTKDFIENSPSRLERSNTINSASCIHKFFQRIKNNEVEGKKLTKNISNNLLYTTKSRKSTNSSNTSAYSLSPDPVVRKLFMKNVKEIINKDYLVLKDLNSKPKILSKNYSFNIYRNLELVNRMSESTASKMKSHLEEVIFKLPTCENNNINNQEKFKKVLKIMNKKQETINKMIINNKNLGKEILNPKNGLKNRSVKKKK